MATTWIVAGDASRARILQVTGRSAVREVETLVNPKGRAHGRELLEDAHSRFRGTRALGSDPEQMSAPEVEAERFSREIGEYLDRARMRHRYDRLFLLAPPRFLGMLRKEVGKLVRDEIDKDLSWFDARDIDRFLKGSGTPAKYP